MTLILSTQADVSSRDGLSSVLDQIGDSIGIPQLSDGKPNRAGATSDLEAVRGYASGLLDKLQNRNIDYNDPSYVGSGRQTAVGGGSVNSGNTSTLEEPNERTYYTQSPNYSIIVQKKAFSGLQDLYKPELMGPGETWLMRASKRLVARKCAIMADYERLTKLESIDQSLNPATVMQSLLTAVSLGTDKFSTEIADYVPQFEASRELERAAFDRQTPRVSTYYIDPDLPFVNALGLGTGTFEITAVGTLSTNLGINGEGSCTFTIEDPYQILIVAEEDIEASLRETALSNLTASFNRVAGRQLLLAQETDAKLAELRNTRFASPITFNVSLRGGAPSAIIDNLGLEVTMDNLDDIPESEALSEDEQRLFTVIMSNLASYNSVLSSSFLQGSANIDTDEIRNDMKYARDKMRRFYLGKSIIQAMDSVHVYIDGGTRRFGEGEEAVDSNNLFTVDKIVKNFVSLGDNKDHLHINEQVIKEEYEKAKLNNLTKLSYNDFKNVRAMDFNGNGIGMHVFGGLVDVVTDTYDASSGKFILSVECKPNMEWLKRSRVNTQPSLNQTEGIVYDPLTPFIIGKDPATHLPNGELELTPENKKRVGDCNLYFNNGALVGKRLRNLSDMKPDQRVLGDNIVALYDHAPGLLYRWKEGIMTATYNAQTINPKDKSFVDQRTLRRDIGLFASSTPFDNMDAANIISTMVTGFPYNYATFVQSAMQTGAFVPDTTLNSGKDFFHSFLDVSRSVNSVQGNFVPFKLLNTDAKEMADSLTQALGAQMQLRGLSSRLSQLRGETAKLNDKIKFLESTGSTDVSAALKTELRRNELKIKEITNEFMESSQNAPEVNSAVKIAGDDVVFDLESVENEEDYKRFGDRLLYETLRKRENVIYNRDKNYLIISDEYDKDYDIQAFVLKLRKQSAHFWKSTYQSPYELCEKVAKMLNFEFFTDTQGNIVFRPPQYNRTPLSVLEAMLLLDSTGGIRLFPDFLINLFKKREDSMISDVIALELEIKMQMALLGASNGSEATNLIGRKVGSTDIFFISERNDIQRAISKNQAIDPQQRAELEKEISQANASTRVGSQQSGVFSSVAQFNLQDVALKEFQSSSRQSNQEYYKENQIELMKLTGRQGKSFAEFDDVKVGAVRNGQSTPSTDVSNIISKTANLVSRRSGLVRMLERVLKQNIQVVKLNTDGTKELTTNSVMGSGYLLGDNQKLTGILAKLIEDTRGDVLGHLSSQRFIIRDEHIIKQSFSERPPTLTNVSVSGTDPIVGESGGNAFGGFPQYIALGVDFDMWRQYGWRGETNFDTPFFWDAELQCAPYAAMLLARQRKNVVQGNITRIGNEFHQLGDVVYSTSRQLLYYVENISHNISYEGQFSTTLKLTYGHPPGEYIPTPLDVIGKSMTSSAGSQNSFRMNRLTPVSESPSKAVLKFTDEPTIEGLLAGKNGRRNLSELKNIAAIFKKEAKGETSDASISPRLYIMTFTDDASNAIRSAAVQSWFSDPQKSALSGAGEGPDGNSGDSAITTSILDESNRYKVESQFIKIENIRQCTKTDTQLTPTEQDLLRLGLVASDEAYTLADDNGSGGIDLSNIVEVRLRFPPSGGWPTNG